MHPELLAPTLHKEDDADPLSYWNYSEGEIEPGCTVPETLPLGVAQGPSSGILGSSWIASRPALALALPRRVEVSFQASSGTRSSSGQLWHLSPALAPSKNSRSKRKGSQRQASG